MGQGREAGSLTFLPKPGPSPTHVYETFRIDNYEACRSMGTMANPHPHLPPTDAELRILQVLWRQGPATARDVHDVLAAERPAAYTTTLKLLQIMFEKALVARADSATRAHVYSAAVTEGEAQRVATVDLLDKVFAGSAAALMQQALAIEPASRDELRRIRDMLDALEAEQGGADA